MPIRLHDSLTRQLQELRPAQPDGVFRFYNCGPTVYAPAHIGNFRTFVVNDVLRRLLELEFGPGKVKHVRNLTDVDDKTIRRARDEGRPLAAVTKQWTDKFHADCDALNCLRPHVEPTATGHLREQVDMIDVLMRKGHAYRTADGSVYFKVSSFEDYGRLSRVKERELQAGSALKLLAADADEKEDGSDFALWKAHKPDDGDNAWDSPWGRGRPGWHIECSAMSKKHLGDTIDLHTGGVDLLFPHHENEIAQSQCCNVTLFAHHWYHSEHLLVDGKKMSKSLGNLYTLDDLVAKGFSPMALRYALLLMGHPRHQLNFTLQSLDTAFHELLLLKGARQWWLKLAQIHGEDIDAASPAPCFTRIIEDLQDDLNTTAARSHLIAGIGSQVPASEKLRGLDQVLSVLGLDLSLVKAPVDELRFVKDEVRRLREKLFRGEIGSIDEVNAQLSSLGWKVEATGETWHIKSLSSPSSEVVAPTEIKTLAARRWAAKQAKDFAAADALRQEIAAAGWTMKDAKDGYTLEPLRT